MFLVWFFGAYLVCFIAVLLVFMCRRYSWSRLLSSLREHGRLRS